MDILRLFFDCDEFCHNFEPRLRAVRLLDGKRHRQRDSTLSLSEVMTIIILFQTSGFRNFKTYYRQHVCVHLRRKFPRLVSYQRFVELQGETVLPLTAFLYLRFGRCTLKLPRSYQWNIALEQSIGSSQSLSLTYIGAIGRDLLRATKLFNVNPNFQFITLADNSATSDYHALQLKFQRRLSRGLQALASYTFSHSIDIASTDAGNNRSTPGTIASPNGDRGNSDFDIRHSFTAGVTYDLPSPGSHKLLRAALGGWSLDAFVLARSAPPVDVLGASFSAAGVRLDSRPNINPGEPLEFHGPQYPGGKIFNRAAFSAAPVGQQGNFGRNVLRGFGASQADVALQRRFHVTEKLGLRFRAEFFNIFNHPNFGNPTNVLTSPLFGRSTQTLANSLGAGGANGGLNPLYQIGGPRSIQLALKLQF